MPDMIGIAERLPDITAAAAVRLDRALAATDPGRGVVERQGELLAKRDALLNLAEARA
jgi:beta-N-acetylhexosaminidase